MKKLWILATLALALAAPIPANADGVTDFVISPTTGYTISTPGSYRLASDVTMTSSTEAIRVQTDNVTLDLGGHTIEGVAVSPGNGIELGTFKSTVISDGRVIRCANGIDGDSGGRDVAISRVTIKDCFESGIVISGSAVRIVECTLLDNLEAGMIIGDESLADRCVASGNNKNGDRYGIFVGGKSVVRACTANNNSAILASGSATGIVCGSSGGVIESCTIDGNKGLGNGDGTGIFAPGGGCHVTGNVCSNNGAGPQGGKGTGIIVGTASRVIGNTCFNNNEGSVANGFSTGIILGVSCVAEGNLCGFNSGLGPTSNGTGIRAAADCIIRNNNITGNDATTGGSALGIEVSSPGCLIENNNCVGQSGGTFNYGIYVNSANTIVRGNTTANNTDGGIRLASAGSAGNTTRAERNRMAEAGGLSDAGGNSLGTGEDANITY